MLTLVEEAARSTEEGIKHFIEPAPGTLRRATNKRHHIVFGRRGSGKSSLLRKAAADLTVDRRPIAYVNLEAFKGHSYPDVLISVLIKTLREFEIWLNSAAIYPTTKKSFWKKLYDSLPTRSSFNKKETASISLRLKTKIAALEAELHRTDDAQLTMKTGSKKDKKDSVSGKVKSGMTGVLAEMGAQKDVSQSDNRELEEKYTRSKTDLLHRNILEYQQLFRDLGKLSSGDSYLFLDDLYHIRRSDQANVVDYFHRIAKDHNLWLKIGSIRHRTRWYIHGDPPIGVKIGDDTDEIDLDLTLEKYSITKSFLVRILSNFAQEANMLTISSFITDGAIDRLVLASGGVARDFLSIFRRSVDVARERGGGHRGDKVGAEDVNVAAGEYDSTKREEFTRDTLDDGVTLEDEFQLLKKFCLDDNNSNCFLLDKEARGHDVELIHELVDLKLVHLVRSRVTVSKRPGRIFEAYMLDLSQYAGSRKRRDLDLVEFWKTSSTEALRKAVLIYEPPQQI
ncbi:MAG: hypothetical protein HHJ12_17135 [Glaciimonas sp.]|nr:hypothetical protein [Glaciimonas sp.]